MFETQPHLPAKRTHSETDPESEGDTSRMDFQHHTEHITETQALGDGDDSPNLFQTELPPPLTPEHAALRADFQMINGTAMENLFRRISADFNASLEKTTNQLQSQILSLNARISVLQGQVLTYQTSAQRTSESPGTAPPVAKKDPKRKKEKQNANHIAAIATGSNGPTYAAVASAANAKPTPTQKSADTRGWTTLRAGGGKKTATPKLIPTTYPKAEREVTCHFPSENTDATHTQEDYVARQATADVALRRVNAAFVNTKDVDVPPFIRARVTIRGAIIFTTSNCQSNVIYEDYTTIIADALSYHGKCEVEVGKRFSQFLLHGVPTQFSLPEISDSIAVNYHQLVQVQTPRWLTPAERRQNKTHSTIVMTLAGNIKKADVGLHNLIICNRECQLEEYIAYGRSTQCRNCQRYGHPAALCREPPRCAVCAGPHETKDHPCSLPACRKGPTCTHPPICCANCNTPHKATDPNCPERIKARTFNLVAAAAIQGDAPMAGVAE
jgi:hypothetical protein